MKTKILLAVMASAISFNATSSPFGNQVNYEALGNALGMAKFIDNEFCSKHENELTKELIERLEEAKTTQPALKKALINSVYIKQGRDNIEAKVKKIAKRGKVDPKQLYNDKELCEGIESGLMPELLFMLEIQGF